MPVTLLLCKIGDRAAETFLADGDNYFVYKNKIWKPTGTFTVTEVKKILYCLKYYGLHAAESEDGFALYAAYFQTKIQNRFSIQAEFFPLIFENYALEDDFCVYVNLTQFSKTNQIKHHAINKFYDALFRLHQINKVNETDISLNLPDSFLPKLCNYQKRSVNWLLNREQQPSRISSFYKRLQARDGMTSVFKNVLYTEFYDEAPQDIVLPPGGILADEMGLGKTVELLGLILLHKWPQKDFEPPEIIDTAFEAVSPPKKARTNIHLLCVCGNSGKSKKLIECKKCNLWQHEHCVCKYNAEHSSNVNEPYMCPSCWKNYSETHLVPSGATLIVTPATIRLQWLNEIKRHISTNLRVYNYEGALSKEWISPRQLANYDIVLTDYNILKREVHYTGENDSDRVLRHKKRSLQSYTPLLMIEWWRCCLDEAQMAESGVSQMAALVRSIPAVNRWAISGTPIQRSIDDLYPLVRFIGLENYVNDSAMSTLVRDFMLHCDDTEHDVSSLHLIKFFGNIMWRTAKKQVEDELPIPPQTEVIHNIVLSDLERLFYTEQHKQCKEKFEEGLDKYFQSSQLIVSTSHNLMNIIMKPLLRIRMCCTIPTIIAPKNQQALTGVIQKQFLQPKELHAHLLAKNEIDCKSHLRSMASAYNGLAALHFIKGEHSEAVNKYETVLKLANEYSTEEKISVDSLLQIHALYNILQARNLSSALEVNRSKEMFEQYETQLNALEWKYLETYASQLCRFNEKFTKAKNALQTNIRHLELSFLKFLSTLLNIDDTNSQTQLLAKILEECLRKFGSMRLEAASSLRGVYFIICTWFDKLEKVQNNIIAAFDELTFFTSNVKPRSQVSVQTWRDVSRFINSVCDCHLIELRELENDRENETNKTENPHNINRAKRQRVGKNLCKLCKLIGLINKYECLLFKKSIDLATNVVEGDENPQLEFEMTKIIFSFLKPKCPTMAVEIEKHYATLQSMQNFCKSAIKFWIEIEFSVKAYDELDMCKMRTTLTEDPAERSNYKIMQHEINLNFVRLEENLKFAKHSFEMKYARLKYIKLLDTDSQVGPCPICHSDEEVRHAFLVCGHQVCWACFKFLTRISHGTTLTCSLCRNVQPTESIYFMTSSKKTGLLNTGEKIIGDYSSKLTYVVRLLKQLIREHKTNEPPNETLDSVLNESDTYPLKILIFSQWTFVLNALAEALTENSITFSQSSSVRSIENFRNPYSGKTCLLMPLHKGCKGLNLIEATHVFLIEPVLNPSEELQAIGRVHRFGQMRPTTVHRFIVEETVEENIFELVSAGKSSSKDWQFDNMTFENLRDLFTQVKNK